MITETLRGIRQPTDSQYRGALYTIAKYHLWATRGNLIDNAEPGNRAFLDPATVLVKRVTIDYVSNADRKTGFLADLITAIHAVLPDQVEPPFILQLPKKPCRKTSTKAKSKPAAKSTLRILKRSRSS